MGPGPRRVCVQWHMAKGRRLLVGIDSSSLPTCHALRVVSHCNVLIAARMATHAADCGGASLCAGHVRGRPRI